MPIDPHSYRALPLENGGWKLAHIIRAHDERGFYVVSRWSWSRQAWGPARKYPALFCYAHVTEAEALIWMKSRVVPKRLGRAPTARRILAWKGLDEGERIAPKTLR